MEIFPMILAKMLFVSFLFGIQIGIIFDALRALRGVFFCELKSEKIQRLSSVKLPFSKRDFCSKKQGKACFLKNAFIFTCDFFWIIYCFLGLVIINYSYNNGGMRFFAIFGLIIGFITYYFTISRLILFLLELLSFTLKYTFFVVLDVISLPFLKLYNKMAEKIKKRCENIRLRLEKKRKKVYNVLEEVYKNTSCENKRVNVKILIQKNQKRGRAENEKK